ncbi:MAG TPA: hypothetical protein VHI93_07050, partial [Candidatus Thermoplasmatota archaeon]|nr:hypothetical protein [Candidatus Thermoplasmatota archaeon]
MNRLPSLALDGDRLAQSSPILPVTGSTATAFTAQVRYADGDGTDPEYVRLRLTDGTLLDLAPGPGSVATGRDYTYSGPLPAGSHTYGVEASDGEAKAWLPATGQYAITVNELPVLFYTQEGNYTADGAHPDHAAQGTPVAFRVRYADPDGSAPQAIQVHVDGVARPLRLLEGAPSNGVYGLASNWSLSLGSHAYFFSAGDGKDTARLPATGTLSFKVSRPPTLAYTGETGYASDGAHPDAVGEGENVTLRVRYTDPDGDPAAFVRARFGNNATLDLAPSPSGGGIYAATSRIPPGVHSYRFEASDGASTVRFPPVGSTAGGTLDDFEHGWLGWSVLQSAAGQHLSLQRDCPSAGACAVKVRPQVGPASLERDLATPLEGETKVSFRFGASTASAGSDLAVKLHLSSGATLVLDLANGTSPNNGVAFTSVGQGGSRFTQWTAGDLLDYTIAIDPAAATARAFVATQMGTVVATSPARAIPAGPATITRMSVVGAHAGGERTEFTLDNIRIQGLPVLRVNAQPTLSYVNATGYRTDGVDPNVAPPSSPATFRVGYRDPDGHPAHVQLKLDNGATWPMALEGGDPRTGATYAVSPPLAAGRYAYWFEASDGERTARIPAPNDPATAVFEETWEAGLGDWAVEAAGASVDCARGYPGCALLLPPACCNHPIAIAKPVGIPLARPVKVEFSFRGANIVHGTFADVELELNHGGKVRATVAHLHNTPANAMEGAAATSDGYGGDWKWKASDPLAWQRGALVVDPLANTVRFETYDERGNLQVRTADVAIPAASDAITKIRVIATATESPPQQILIDNLRVTGLPGDLAVQALPT